MFFLQQHLKQGEALVFISFKFKCDLYYLIFYLIFCLFIFLIDCRIIYINLCNNLSINPPKDHKDRNHPPFSTACWYSPEPLNTGTFATRTVLTHAPGEEVETGKTPNLSVFNQLRQYKVAKSEI